MRRIGSLMVGFAVLLGVSGCESKDGGGEKTGAVTLSVFVGGVPAADVAVYLQAPDGSLRAELATDSSGLVAADAPINGMITTTHDIEGYRFIRTIAGLQDGDELEVRFAAASAVVGTPVIVMGSALNGVEEYVVDAGSCGAYLPGDEPVLTLALDLYSTCVNTASTYDVLVTAVDANFEAIAYAVLEDVPLATTTAFMPAWNTIFASQTITLDNGPTGYFDAGGSLIEEGGSFQLYDNAYIDVDRGHAGVTLNMPSNFGYALNSTYFVYDDTAEFFPASFRYGRAAIEESVALDFTTDFYPFIESATFDGAVRPEVTVVGAPADADYVAIRANWEDNGDYTLWNVLLPPDAAGSLRFPELPDGVVPPGSPYHQQFGFYDASYLDGYDELRTGDYAFPEDDYAVRATIVQP